MAGEVRIGGTTANVRLQGNDSYTADRTFTFPDASGELLIDGGNTTNVGTGGTAGQAQVAGYQTGLWLPEFIGSTTNGSFTYENGRTGFWSRIGTTVTVTFRIYRVTVVSNGTGTLGFSGAPYPVDATQGTHVSPGSARLSNVDYDANTAGLASNISSTSSRLSIIRNIAGAQSTAIRCDELYTGSTETDKSSVYVTLTYFTDDTSWTPTAGASVTGTAEYQARLAEIASNPNNFEADE